MPQSPKDSGTPMNIQCRANALTQLGNHITFLHFNKTTKPGPSIAKLWRDIPLLLQARKHILTGRYDLIIAVEETAIAHIWARKAGIPCLYSVHSHFPLMLKEWKKTAWLSWILAPTARLFQQWMVRKCDGVITHCHNLEKEIRRYRPKKTFLIYNHIREPMTTTDKETFKTRHNLHGRRLIVYTGSFAPNQGLDLAIHAATLSQHLGTTWCLVGGTDEETKKLRSTRTLEARQAAIANKCYFPGKVTKEEANAWVNAADILLTPRHDGINVPFKLFEYMASGRPIVACKGKLYKGYLRHMKTAFISPPTAGDLATTVNWVLDHPDIAETISKRCRQEAEIKYSGKQYLAKLQKMIEVMTRGKPRTGKMA